MPPRGRTRKTRNTRMDAAVDAMTKTYGFSEEIVKRVAKDLLKEYEGDQGDEGWFFIEQYSYQELIDAILRDQEQNDQDNPLPPDRKEDALPENASLQDGKAEEHALADTVERSSLHTETSCSVVGEKAGNNVLETNDRGEKAGINGLETNDRGEKAEEYSLPDAVGPSGVLIETSCSKVVENGIDKLGTNNKDVDHLPPSNKDEKSFSQNERADAICDKHEKSDSQDLVKRLIVPPPPLTPATPLGTSVPSQLENSPLLSPLPMISSPPRVKSVQNKRRQPCNGWIESDEEEVDDFIYLTPAIEWEDLCCRADRKAKRSSRWDLRPEDN